MMGQTRMSPLTAFFLGVFGVGGVAVVSGAGVVAYALSVIDSKANTILAFAESTLTDLPDLVAEMPDLMERLPALADSLGGVRVADYTSNVDIDVHFAVSNRHGGLKPVMTITNNGDEVISMLAIRVAALNEDKLPIREWTEVVATPVAVENEWRGPLFPGKTRHVVVSGWRTVPEEDVATITGAVEISELRIWRPKNAF